MNKTNQIAALSFEEKEDRLLAQKYFKNLYGDDIDYLAESDSYFYRGIEFDYFKSGIPLDKDGEPSFLLVDKERSWLWVYTYGDQEERWEDYCSVKYWTLEERPLCERVKNYIGGLFK